MTPIQKEIKELAGRSIEQLDNDGHYDMAQALNLFLLHQQELIEQQTVVFEKIKAEMDRFMSLLNINFETHGTIEDQAKAYNDVIEQKDAEIGILKQAFNNDTEHHARMIKERFDLQQANSKQAEEIRKLREAFNEIGQLELDNVRPDRIIIILDKVKRFLSQLREPKGKEGTE
jgi:hypothetical protein